MSKLDELRDRLFYQPLSLGLIALATSAALSFANQSTQEGIADAEKRDLQTSLSEVLPAGHGDNDLLKDTVTVADNDGKEVTIYRSRKAGTVNGVVFKTAARGYAGDIVVLIGLDEKGTMLGARVIKHQETPGLGDKIEVAKSKWIHDFEGKSLDNLPAEKWAVKKDGGVFDQFAGATITPRAVVKAVKQGLDFYAGHREEILSAPTQGEAK
ncbi:electron transport complex subunit RsxG [Propionivibrio limicola]|uniref:electron transport complex subunit RsxG n=1 Tax=Propionivibrio limicola TaxID=167645 RepID=UPI0012911877|nr:electron transport complex subunit RsxG [Propionivibrio limicola]